MRLALAQLNPLVGDLPGNTRKCVQALTGAARNGADLVLFPELMLCGYPPEDLLFYGKFIREGEKRLAELAGHTGPVAALIGAPSRGPGGLFNSAVLLSGGKIRERYHKHLLPNYSVFDEKRYFRPGREILVLKLSGYHVGVTVCEDLWQPGGPERELARAGVDLIVNLSASPYERGKRLARERLFGGVARRCKAAVAYCNLVGGQDELVFDGNSFVLDRTGKVVARAPQFEDHCLFVDLKEPGVKAMKTTLAKPLAPAEEVFRALVLGIRDYAHKNGFTDALLGMSGGIDSALVAALAAEALGPSHIHGISMPSRYSSRGTRSDARRVCERLKIAYREIPIQGLCESFAKALAPDFAGLPSGLAEENLQARIRACLLMAHSNKFGRLLLSTGNKSEASVGYCTLYGDMAGGFAPIKDLPKGLVYELSAWFNRSRGRDLIPRSVMVRPPTAELKPGQKDSDSLPVYPVLDRILRQHIEGRRDIAAIRGASPSVKAEVVRKVRTSEYKRRQSAPGIKITALAFGKERRMPITNGYSF